jgi:hypothetical protein
VKTRWQWEARIAVYVWIGYLAYIGLMMGCAWVLHGSPSF